MVMARRLLKANTVCNSLVERRDRKTHKGRACKSGTFRFDAMVMQGKLRNQWKEYQKEE
jgi:hypothetical protein